MLSWVNFSIYRIYFVDPKTTKRELWDQMSELRMHQRKDQRSTSQDVEQTGVKSELIRWFETNKQMNQNSWLHGPDAWTLCWCAWRNNKQRETLAASISALACSYMAATQEVKIKCKKKLNKTSDYNCLIDTSLDPFPAGELLQNYYQVVACRVSQQQAICEWLYILSCTQTHVSLIAITPRSLGLNA